MPAKGQLMAPKLNLRRAHDIVMKRIDTWEDAIGVFFVGGRIAFIRSSVPTFNRRAKKLESQLVGVYDIAADSRDVLADLQTFYRCPGSDCRKAVV